MGVWSSFCGKACGSCFETASRFGVEQLGRKVRGVGFWCDRVLKVLVIAVRVGVHFRA